MTQAFLIEATGYRECKVSLIKLNSILEVLDLTGVKYNKPKSNLFNNPLGSFSATFDLEGELMNEHLNYISSTGNDPNKSGVLLPYSMMWYRKNTTSGLEINEIASLLIKGDNIGANGVRGNAVIIGANPGIRNDGLCTLDTEIVEMYKSYFKYLKVNKAFGVKMEFNF